MNNIFTFQYISGSVLVSAVYWLLNLFINQLSQLLCTIAIAFVGFSMLSGRMNIKRGLSIIFGCFIIFSAREIADGLRMTATDGAAPSVTGIAPIPESPKTQQQPNNVNAFDPYSVNSETSK